MSHRSSATPKRAATSPLEQRFSYLFHRISARVALIGNRHFKTHALNHYSARMLVLLLQHGALRTGDLVELMLLPQSTISTQLQALHLRRLINRRRAPADNRAVIVTLTSRGRVVAKDCDDLSRKVQAVVGDALSGAERRSAYRLLGKIDACLARIQGHTLHEFASSAGARRPPSSPPSPA